MNLTGIWKPYGKYVNKDQIIMIQGQEITFGIGVAGPNSKQTTVHFHLEEGRSLRENNCHNIIIDEEQFKNTDYMVHEENIEGKTVVILSYMIMEYDGRGRIVFHSYVREEDYELLNDDFKSLAYQHWNDRPSVPMTQMNLKDDIPMAMMGRMMGSMMLGMPGMMPGASCPVVAPGSVTQVEPWDCSCGNKQITTKFCQECGMPKQ